MLRPAALSILTLVAPLFLPSTAFADDDGKVAGGATLLVGPGYWAEDAPARLRLSIRGEAALATSDKVGLGLVIPLDIASSGQDGFGWSTDRTLLEFVPAARLRVAPESVVRGYADAGVGPWLSLRETNTVFGSAESQRTGLMTSTALGLEIGEVEAESITFVVEPIRLRTYFTNDEDRLRADYGGMIGVGVRF